MKTLKAHIDALALIYSEHGDIPIIYSSDDEGNSFQHVVYDPGTMKMVSDGRNLEAEEDNESATLVCCIN